MRGPPAGALAAASPASRSSSSSSVSSLDPPAAAAAVAAGRNLQLLLPLIVVLAYAIHSYVRKCIEYRAESAYGASHGCQPMNAKLPTKWPLGLDLLKRQYVANKRNHLLLSQTPLLDALGPNLEITVLGSTGYLTYDHENLEAILSTHFEDYGLGSRSDGFRYQDLKGFTEHIDDLVSELSARSCEGAIVDLQPLFFRLTLATTTALIFGQPVKSFDGEEQNTFASSFDYASMIIALRIRLSELYWVYTPSKYRIACGIVKSHAIDFVNQALAHGKEESKPADGKYAFIQDLYNELEDPKLVRDQLVHVLLAGRDTTACLLTWTFFFLVRHPSVLRRLRAEIQEITPGASTLTRALVQKLPYLKCVLNETCRLYPPVPVNVRFATKTTVIPRGGGSDGQSPVLIRKGKGIGSSAYHLHRRKDLYGDDADDFRPERWERDQLANIGWGFLPFLGGPRQCLGKDFALMEASCVIVRMLQTFPNIRLPPEHIAVPTGQEGQNLTVVLSSAEGCKVRLD